LSSSTLTPLSPEKPSPRPWVYFEISDYSTNYVFFESPH